jgi:predicted metal-dependent hydrolase
VPSFKYQIVRKKKFTGNISISISERRGVVVNAPFWVTEGLIRNFIEEKSEWIKKHLKHIGAKKVSKQYCEGEKHLYFGKEYSLVISTSETHGRSKINLTTNSLEIQIPKGIPEEKFPEKVKDALLYWYLEMGIEIITGKVNHYSKVIGVNYKKINLKKVSSIWGSCSPTNCLSFNRKLVMAPHEVVDYVVIHEVSHMVHRNHGTNFWNLVKSLDPEYKNHRKWLRQNHHLLAI